MFEEVYLKTRNEMLKAIDVLKKQFAAIRVGQASSTLLDGVKCPVHSNLVPIIQLATIYCQDSRLVIVKPWDKALLKSIEKAIRLSDLGLDPQIKEDFIRVPIPSLTQDRRKDLLKQIKNRGEEAKIIVRNLRREGNLLFKASLKNAIISEDEEKKMHKSMQELTDKTITEIEKLIINKQNSIEMI